MDGISRNDGQNSSHRCVESLFAKLEALTTFQQIALTASWELADKQSASVELIFRPGQRGVVEKQLRACLRSLNLI
jgi:hypothetical protein